MQINNLARDNLQDKLPLLAELVTDEYWPYFANYMVVKRAAQVATGLLQTHVVQTLTYDLLPCVVQPCVVHACSCQLQCLPFVHSAFEGSCIVLLMPQQPTACLANARPTLVCLFGSAANLMRIMS